MPSLIVDGNNETLSCDQIRLGDLHIARHQSAKGRSGMPTFDDIIEAEFKREVHEDTMAIMENMNTEEQLAIAFVPLVIAHFAWHYAKKALAIARLRRISALKELTRTFDRLYNGYEKLLSQDLQPDHIRHFQNEANRMLETCAYDFTVFYYTVNNEVHRAAPELEHEDLITYALMSVLMVRALNRHNAAVSKILIERLGPDKGSVTNPFLTALETLMQACTCNCPVNLDDNIQLCMNIFHNNINKIQFNVI